MGERGWVSALQHAKDDPQSQHDLLRLALDAGTTHSQTLSLAIYTHTHIYINSLYIYAHTTHHIEQLDAKASRHSLGGCLRGLFAYRVLAESEVEAGMDVLTVDSFACLCGVVV